MESQNTVTQARAWMIWDTMQINENDLNAAMVNVRTRMMEVDGEYKFPAEKSSY